MKPTYDINSFKREQPSLYKDFCRIEQTLKPIIKEIITLSTKNLLDLSECLLAVYERLNNPNFQPRGGIFECIEHKVKTWNEEMLMTQVSHRRSMSRKISDLKYIIGNVECSEQLFLEIDDSTAKIKQEWTSSLIGKTSESLRQNFMDIIMIMDPKIKGNYQELNQDFKVIEQRVREVERHSLSFLDTNREFMLEGYKEYFHKMSNPVSPIGNKFSRTSDESCDDDLKKKIVISDAKLGEAKLTKQIIKIGGGILESDSENLVVIKNKRLTPIKKRGFSKGSVVIVKKPVPISDFNIQPSRAESKEVVFSNEGGTEYDVNEERFDFSISVEEENETHSYTEADQYHHMAPITLENLKRSPVNEELIAISNALTPNKNVYNMADFSSMGRTIESSSVNRLSKENFKFDSLNYNNYQEEKLLKTIQKDYNSRTAKMYSNEVEIDQTLLDQGDDLETMDYLDRRTESDKENINDLGSFGNDTLTLLKSPTSKNHVSRFGSLKDSLNFSNYTFNRLESKNSPEYFSLKSCALQKNKLDMFNRIRKRSETTNMTLTKTMDYSLNDISEISMVQSKFINQNKNKNKNMTLDLTSKQSDESFASVNLMKMEKGSTEYYESKIISLNSKKNSNCESSHIMEVADTNKTKISNQIRNIRGTPLGKRNEAFMYTSSRASCLSSETIQLAANPNTCFKKKNVVVKRSSSKKQYDLEEWDNFRRIYNQNSNPTTPLRATIDYQEQEVALRTPTCNGSKVKVDLKEKFLEGSKNFDEFLKNRNSEKLHVRIKNIEKVCVSNDNNYLLFGGKGLHVLDMTKEKFRLIRYDKNQGNLASFNPK